MSHALQPARLRPAARAVAFIALWVLALGASALGACGGDDGPLLVVTVTGGETGLSALRVALTLDGQESLEVREIQQDLGRFGLRLPSLATGNLVVHIEGVDPGRCVAARGVGQLALSPDHVQELTVELRHLPDNLCVCSAFKWCWENPVPQGNTLNGVWSLAPDDVWAVGDQGTIFHYDGVEWQTQATGMIENLYAIWGDTDGDLWVAGERGVILRRIGGTWSSLPNPDTIHDLRAVWGVHDGDVWLGGDGGVLLRVTNPRTNTPPVIERPGVTTTIRAIWSTGLDNTWIAGDGGFLLRQKIEKWQPPFGYTPAGDLRSLWGVGTSDVWAGGQGGRMVHVDIDNDRTTIEATPTPRAIESITGDNADDLWAVGGNPGEVAGVVLRRRNGRWENLPVSSQDGLNALFSVVGAGPRDIWAVGLYGTILHFADEMDTPLGSLNTTRTIQGLWGSGPYDMWAVGRRIDQEVGAVLHYDGRDWSLASLPEGSAAPALTAVSGIGPKEIYAVGYTVAQDNKTRQPSVLRYDGNWHPEVVSVPGDVALRAVWVAAPGDVWAAGDKGTVLHRENGAWVSRGVESSVDLRAVWGLAPISLAPGAGEQMLWIGGSGPAGGLLRRLRMGPMDSETGALRWEAAFVSTTPLPAVRAIAGSGQTDIWALTERSPMRHFDGTTWQAVDSNSNRTLEALWVGGPDTALAAGQDGYILYWDGRTWVRHISGSANTLRAIWGTSLYDLTTAGDGGSILRQRL